MNRRPVLIDTDTGVDDALAIALALRSDEINVVGITTVAGNVEVSLCTRNVHALMDRLHVVHAPRVVVGASRPSVLPLVTAPEVHGKGGMGALTPATAPAVRGGAARAARFITQMADRHGDDLTIVAIGPLTNLGAAYRLAPAAMRKVGRVISMGGAFHVPGNTGPVAEFNYFVDPHAVAVVLEHARDLLIVPLDVTESLTVLWSEVERRTKTPSARWMRRLVHGYMEYHRLTEGFKGAYLHDPIAVAEAIVPGVITAVNARVEIVSREGPSRGMTSLVAADRASRRSVRVGRSLNRDTFTRLFHRVWPAT